LNNVNKNEQELPDAELEMATRLPQNAANRLHGEGFSPKRPRPSNSGAVRFTFQNLRIGLGKGGA